MLTGVKLNIGIQCQRNFQMKRTIFLQDPNAVWLKGNLHSHTVNSDGELTPEEMKGVPHFLLDVAEPGDYFSLKDYQKLAYEAIDDIRARGRLPFLVGGTGLYVNAVTDGYELTEAPVDEDLRKKVEAMSITELTELLREKLGDLPENLDLKNKRRLERAAEKALMDKPLNLTSRKRYDTLVLGVTWERQKLYKRIEERLDRRLEEGMIEEVGKQIYIKKL